VQCSKTGIPHTLPKLEKTLGAMYKKWRRVLQRETKPNISKVSEKMIDLKYSGSLWADLIYSKLLHFGTQKPYKLTHCISVCHKYSTSQHKIVIKL